MIEQTQSAVESEGVPVLDTGLACLVMLAHSNQVAISPAHIIHEFAIDNAPLASSSILLAARKIGFNVKEVTASLKDINQTFLPAIASKAGGGYFVLTRISTNKALVHDPLAHAPEVITVDELSRRWAGELILFSMQSSNALEVSRFDFTWFVPVVVKYRKLLGEILLASFVLQLFALVVPLFFQVVMDKVLVQQGLTTLDVLAVGLVGVVCFETVLSGMRSYVFSHTASRIDVELGSRLFRHLITLPISYFQSRRVGDSVARVRELESIRGFLTGNSITLVLDVLFSLVFIFVMFYYSGWLTIVVVLSFPLYFLVSLLITPFMRARLDENFSRSAENQAFLVETITGIDTIKSMAVEPHIVRKWDHQLAGYVFSGFRSLFLSALANESVSLIGKFVTVVTLWWGAKLVVGGQLSVGQLIAFNMLAGRVVQPIMRLAQLWNSFQQIGVSVQRLGEILNLSSEGAQAVRSVMPPIKGSIDFQQVSFRYRAEGRDVLRGIDLTIKAGEMVGVVGRSGSGKSTLTRLLQRLYVPQQGRVLVDGMDLAFADVASLRRQIGVVLQENILFNRSIRENIALADPGAPIESVMQVAILAGAHDFIMELPEAYDTVVGEHGASLSGGQRQRIAIARALIGNPRILIFDEATSALDYESEQIIQQNMRAICKGRTVMIIAHRLSAVRDADRIVVVDRGQLVEQGTHAQLLSYQSGHYSNMQRLQQGNIDE